jgi:asparagine synthetase B (glutamine-hydrolysing)
VDRDWSLSFTSTVLALRGSKLVEQPLVSAAGEQVLCWNGEAWRIGGSAVSRNDGVQVLEGLSVGGSDPAGLLRSIQGPFAFVFFSKTLGRLYFGRDRLGRRSLLICQTEDALKLSSVADEPHEGWQEVEADGFYSIDVRATFDESLSTLTRHSWVLDENLVGCSSELCSLSV